MSKKDLEKSTLVGRKRSMTKALYSDSPMSETEKEHQRMLGLVHLALDLAIHTFATLGYEVRKAEQSYPLHNMSGLMLRQKVMDGMFPAHQQLCKMYRPETITDVHPCYKYLNLRPFDDIVDEDGKDVRLNHEMLRLLTDNHSGSYLGRYTAVRVEDFFVVYEGQGFQWLRDHKVHPELIDVHEQDTQEHVYFFRNKCEEHDEGPLTEAEQKAYWDSECKLSNLKAIHFVFPDKTVTV